MFLGTLGGRSSCQKAFSDGIKEIMDNKFILVGYVGQGQNWGQKRPQKHSKFGNLKFKPQYHRPDKCNRPIDRAPDPACPIVSSKKQFFFLGQS